MSEKSEIGHKNFIEPNIYLKLLVSSDQLSRIQNDIKQIFLEFCSSKYFLNNFLMINPFIVSGLDLFYCLNEDLSHMSF